MLPCHARAILYKSKQSNYNELICALKKILGNQAIWVSMNSPGPPLPRFDILSWLRTTWTLMTPRSLFFVPNPYNMGVYGLPWTQAIKIWHFELTQDHLEAEDSKGMRRLLCFSSSKPLQYGCLQTPLVTSDQDLTFWAESGQPGHWGL